MGYFSWEWGKWPYGSLRKWGGPGRNALPLRSERSSTKLEITSLSTDVPLGFLYAASPLPPLQFEATTCLLHIRGTTRFAKQNFR